MLHVTPNALSPDAQRRPRTNGDSPRTSIESRRSVDRCLPTCSNHDQRGRLRMSCGDAWGHPRGRRQPAPTQSLALPAPASTRLLHGSTSLRWHRVTPGLRRRSPTATSNECSRSRCVTSTVSP